MSASKWLALLGLLCSAVVFVYNAFRHRRQQLSFNNYLLSNQEVDGHTFVNAYVAGGFCLSANMIFFVSSHESYGWLMIVPPFLHMLTQGLLMHWLQGLPIDADKARTAADLWFIVFPSKLLAKCISALVAMTCFMSVFLELYVGSVLSTLFVPDSSKVQVVTFFVLGLLTFGYVRMGGFKAIVKTDTWQLSMVLAACAGIAAFALQVPAVNNRTLLECLSNVGSYQASGWTLWIFMLWAFIINFCLGFTDPAMWQRTRAARSGKESVQALCTGSWKMLVVIGVPSVSCVLLGLKGYQFSTIPEFLHVIGDASGQSAGFLFPVIVVGLGAALFSTADTYMLAAMYALCDQNTLGQKMAGLTAEEQHRSLNHYLTLFSVTLLTLLTGFYYLQSTELAQYVMPILYAVWGQTAVLAPLIIYAVYHLSQSRSPLLTAACQEKVLFAAIIMAWLTVIAGSMAEVHYNDAMYAQASLFVGLIEIILGLYAVVALKNMAICKTKQFRSA